MRLLEEAVDRVREPRIVVRPVGREHQVVVPQLGHDVLGQLLLRLDRDEALAAEELGWLGVLLEQLVVAVPVRNTIGTTCSGCRTRGMNLQWRRATGIRSPRRVGEPGQMMVAW
jgi:hypothetical protein